MAIELSREKKGEPEIGKTDKPSRIDKIKAALIEIEEKSSLPDCVTETPGAFLLEFYKAWVENGGQDGGKNRNSIRRMRDVWLTGEHEVKSLHPKLTGRVRVSKDDARALMSLFLGRWTFVGVKEGDWILTPDGYAPFACRDCKKLCDQLADAMFPKGSEQEQIGLNLPAHTAETLVDGGEDGWKTVAKLYRESDAVINFSRHRVAIGETPPETMKFFWRLFKNFYETLADRNQVFIWIIDIGNRQAEDDEAWAEFFNFEMLKAQFRAFATFDSEDDSEEGGDDAEDQQSESQQRSAIREAFLRSLTIPEQTHREKRWKWLCDHTVIIIQNLRKEEFDHLYEDDDAGIDRIRLKDIGVTAENILPKMLPHSWARHRQLRDLYGSRLDNVADATLTAFYKEDGWPVPDTTLRVSKPIDVRYFAHALTHHQATNNNLNPVSVALSKEINSPGDAYDEAFKIVYWAARHRLLERGDESSKNSDWAIAIAYLNNQGFRALRLPDFLAIHRSPFE